jgi:hypothetical protein
MMIRSVLLISLLGFAAAEVLISMATSRDWDCAFPIKEEYVRNDTCIPTGKSSPKSINIYVDSADMKYKRIYFDGYETDDCSGDAKPIEKHYLNQCEKQVWYAIEKDKIEEDPKAEIAVESIQCAQVSHHQRSFRIIVIF